MKICPRCPSQGREGLKDLSEFGICRERKDGLNLYCKICIREKIAIQRAAKKEYNDRVKRKPCVTSQAIRRLEISDREKVQLAYRRGITDRVEIQRATKIWMHDLMEIIAELNDAGVIKWNREARCFQLAA